MKISEIQNNDQTLPCETMDGTTKPLVQLASSVRTLPGCRPCGLRWNECEVDLNENDNGQGVIVCFQLAGTAWTRELKMKNGQLQVNLQELEILRWIAEGETSAAFLRLRDYHIQYVPQKRYCCLFPHQAIAAHDVMEIVSGMTTVKLKEVGEEAIRDCLVMLCPAPAPLCTERSHTSVIDEVHELAQHWPARQVLCAPAVDGMIDICPVYICRNDAIHNQCIVFETDETRTAMTPTDIRTNMLLGAMHVRVEHITKGAINNPQIALHPSWHGDIFSATQDAVLQCQHRRANAQPTRLFDAHEETIKSGIRPEHYLALSYSWGEWPVAKNDALTAKIKEMSRRLAVRYFWVDRWCINQHDDADKAREIKRMREYYMGASGCVVLAGPTAEPFQCLPQHSGTILSAFQQIMLNQSGLQSLIRCEWATRVWTLQEALLSRQLVYAVQDQLIDGDFISELVAYIETFSEEFSGDGEPGGEEPEWLGGYGSYRWNATAATIVYPRQFRLRKASNDSLQFTILRTVFGGEQQYEQLQLAGGVTMEFEEALTMVTDRNATNKEDYVYGILGICEGGDKIDVKYEITWRNMLEKLQKAGMITERQLASPTVNDLPGMSWLPKCGSGYGPFKNMERLAAFVPRPRLSFSEQGVTVLGAVFEWEEFECKEWDVLNIHGMACHLVRGTIRFPDTPGLLAKVGGTTTPQSGFHGDRMSGIHVMLCQDVDENTSDTVAIKVSGDIDGGNVRREDGYVLELHRWVEGDPRLLKGRQWTIT